MKEGKNFEKMMEELEQIASELESGELSLDESVKKFEDGMKISKECSEILESTEKRINILIKKDENIIEEEFNAGE